MSYRPASPAAVEAIQAVMHTLERLPIADRLLALRSLAVLLGSRRAAAVLAARAEGFSWAEIAGRLGMSRQSVWERYGSEAGVAVSSPRGSHPESRPRPPSFSSCAAYKAVSRRPDLPAGG
ncbi:MAG: sigma factor-like helix-turn-helix DNA-binding protein [Candidatus Dormibacteria bacterium]